MPFRGTRSLGLLLLLSPSSGFYLSHLINRRIDKIITPTHSPFAVCECFSTEDFRSEGLMDGARRAAAGDVEQVLLDLPTIAATKDIIADASSRGLLVRVLGTRVVASGSRLALQHFVSAISCERVRGAAQWGSQPAPLLL